MKRYFIYLSYDGSNYCGWQRQPNGKTVQEVIEDALKVLLRCDTPIVGAGRTDAGVHARMMIAHFDYESGDLDCKNMVDRLNGFLPKDIAVQKIVEVKADAHARFDAVSRLYRYYVTAKKNPFLINTHHRIFEEPDLQNMNDCAKILFDYEDFTSFSKLHTDVKTNNCKIMHAQWEQRGDEFIFTIKADRFLRNMVRAIVGTLLEAGKGPLRLDTRGMNRIVRAKNRQVAGTSAPGYALFLEEVEYPDDIFIIK